MRTLTKCQSLNSLLTIHSFIHNYYFSGSDFLDLLIKFMKIMLLYILYWPPPPHPHHVQESFNPWPSYHQSSPSPSSPAIWNDSRMSAKISAGYSIHITISPWNLVLNSKVMERILFLKHVLFLLSNIWLQRYDYTDFEQILKKNVFFHAVGSCTLWPEMGMSWGKQVTCLAGRGGGVWGRTSMCGMAKDKKILAFETFSRISK